MISQYKLDLIRFIKNEAIINYETKEVTLPAKFFPEFEPDSIITFSNWSEMSSFVINKIIELN